MCWRECDVDELDVILLGVGVGIDVDVDVNGRM